MANKMPVQTILGDRIESGDYRDALPVNYYVVAREVRGSSGYLINQPGLKKLGDTTGVDRGGFYSAKFEIHFRIAGTDLLSIASDGSTTVLGEIPGSLQVRMAESFNNFAVLANGLLFYWNPTDGFRQITDPNLGDPVDFCWIKGVLFFTDGENLYHTTLLDEEVINPLDFATSEISPDPTVSVNRTKENQVIVGDTHTFSYFYFSGGENFAFTPIDGRSVKSGVISPQAIAELEGQWFYIGGRDEESLFVYQAYGTDHPKISTREIDKILASYSTEELQTASIESRAQDGYYFLHINLPNDTLMFNYTIAKLLGSGLAWTRLKTSENTDDGWRGINGIFDKNVNMWVYGDRFAPQVGTLDNTISTLYEEKTEFIFYTPFISLEGMSINQAMIKTIPGFSPGKATVAMSLTYDGETYGKEWWAEYSEKNKRDLRFSPNRLGNVDDYVSFKFRTVTDSLLNFGSLVIDYG